MDQLPIYSAIEAECADHRIKILFSGQERLASLLEEIGAARHSLRLCYYIFAADEVSTRVADALIDARNRGVSVTLLVDGFGTRTLPDHLFAPFIEAGVIFIRFLPRIGRRYLLRNHQKLLIADERIAIIGGSNIENSYFADDPAGESWHDLALRIEGEAAARLARYFDALARWLDTKKPTIRRLNAILSRFSENKGQLRWIFSGPFPRINPMRRSIVADVIRSKRLEMIQAYFAPSAAILRKLGRSKRFRLITAARSDNQMTMNAARHCYKRLIKNGAEIAEYVPQKLHMKLIVADDVIYIGSANFDIRSLYINAEIMLRIEDSGLADQLRSAFDSHWANSQSMNASDVIKSPGLWTRAVRFLSYLIVSSIDLTVTRSLNSNRD
jgi:cardiolipin synthase A/B